MSADLPLKKKQSCRLRLEQESPDSSGHRRVPSRPTLDWISVPPELMSFHTGVISELLTFYAMFFIPLILEKQTSLKIAGWGAGNIRTSFWD